MCIILSIGFVYWLCVLATLKNVVCLDYTCKMGELALFGQRDDSDPLDVWTGKTPDQCKTKCLAMTDCDAFTYVTKDHKCIAHKKIISPKKADSCSYWAKTCPGLQGEGSK